MAEDNAVSLTDQAMARLKRLAEGNGVAESAIALLGSDEKVYVLEGTLTLRPKCEVLTARTGGATGGGKRKTLPDFQTLRHEALEHQKQFHESTDWVPEAIRELKAAPAEGWGLQDAVITLPERSVTFSASESCPNCQGRQLLTCQQCQGQGHVICPQCTGIGREPCPTCGGTGNNPMQPDQRCVMCNGMREAPCRYCNGRGQLNCPTCHGRRGTPCPTCAGIGKVSEEITINCRAETHFKLTAEEMPSGMRRGLDRLGVVNLVNGHADIETLQEEKEKKKPVEPGMMGQKKPEEEEKPVPEVHYRAKVPYADLRMRFFEDRAVLVSAFGKKCSLLGVPAFLDDALQGARDKLKLAAYGKGPLDAALTPRAMREALGLVISGKGQVTELRRYYPVGLSPEAMKEILLNMRLAVKRMTLRMRSLTAVACGVLSTGLFAAVFMTGVHAQVTEGWRWQAELLFDTLLLAAALVVSWFGLAAAIRADLKQRFPDLAIAVQEKTGKTGYTMLAGIVVCYAAVIVFAPVKPGWLAGFF